MKTFSNYESRLLNYEVTDRQIKQIDARAKYYPKMMSLASEGAYDE